ncbi:hypothetical protein B566_EDAN010143 [Ephemera danica]|nr:hypothetical protein B566_EDAN010143 [Ephemera danica]
MENQNSSKKTRRSKMLFSTGTKLAIIVRTDLSMKKGKIAAQCCHAAVGCFRLARKKQPRILSHWEGAGEPKVVLKCSNEEEMLSLETAAKSLGLLSVLIRDAGRTQVEAGSITALGIGPAEQHLLDEVVGHLKLL